jgi:chemotaxis protein methyltransferase CheR
LIAAAPRIPPADDTLSIRDSEFTRFQIYIERESGIFLSTAKKALLTGRLGRRLRELGLTSFDAYLEIVERDEDERVRMFDRITTNETHFFREPKHFDLLENLVFPRWDVDARSRRRSRRVVMWSAACATGEEPFSLAMLFRYQFPPSSGWHLDVLATDLSTRALDAARGVTWPIERIREVPPHLLKRFMLRGIGSQAGKVRICRELRRDVRFDRLNLCATAYPFSTQFDLILCRNVLIYFRAPERERILGRLISHLAPGGYLVLGHAETLRGFREELAMISPNFYQKG